MSAATAPTTAVQKAEDRAVEFIPFGARDAIKLTAGMVRNFVANPTKSGKLPDERQCIRFVMLCKARQLNPFEGDAFLIGYDGTNGPEFSLITAHQAFLKRAEANPEYDGMESGVIVEADNDQDMDYNEVRVIRKTKTRITYAREGDLIFSDETLVGGWAQVNFKQRKTPTLRQVNLKTFDKGFGLWKDAGKPGMIVKCAEADALRSSFPTLLGGMYVEGEHQPLTVEAEQTISPAMELQNKLLSQPGQVLDLTTPHTDAEPVPVKPAKGTKKPDTAVFDNANQRETLTENQQAVYDAEYEKLLNEAWDLSDAHAAALKKAGTVK